MPLRALQSLAVFGGALIADPRPVGAPFPSSRVLSRRIASLVPRWPQGYVVELGAGTGSVTEALLERGLPVRRLIAVERSENMVRLLKQRFPSLAVMHGDAADLTELLGQRLNLKRQRISHIVSSLPLRSLPRPAVTVIIEEIKRLLSGGGQFIQYTYDLRPEPHRALSDFVRSSTSVVWRNIPPARVDVFQPRLEPHPVAIPLPAGQMHARLPAVACGHCA